MEVWKGGRADGQVDFYAFCMLIYYIINKLKVHIEQTRELLLLIGMITVR